MGGAVAMLGAVLATVLFSLSAVSANRSVRMLGGVSANFWRLLLAAVLLAIWAHAFGQGLGGGAVGWFFWSGCIGFGLGDLALFQALPRLGSRLTVLLVQCLAAPIAALTEWLWLGTAPTRMQMLCAVVILAGVAVALAPGKDEAAARRQVLAGVLFGLVGAVGQALGAVCSRKAYAVVALAGGNVDGVTAAYQRILGGVLLGGIALLWVRRRSMGARVGTPGASQDASARQRSWFWVAANALTGPVLGVSCYQWALQGTPTGVVLPIVATTPLVVIPVARWIDGERHGRRSLVGGLIAVAGAVGLSWATGR